MEAAELERVQRVAERATGKADAATAARDGVIRRASRDGTSIRRIAAITGLSSARVHQILHGR